MKVTGAVYFSAEHTLPLVIRSIFDKLLTETDSRIVNAALSLAFNPTNKSGSELVGQLTAALVSRAIIALYCKS